MFGAKCILLMSLVSFSWSQFLETSLSLNDTVDVREFVNKSKYIWTVHSARAGSTGQKVDFCKVDIIEEKAADSFTFKRILKRHHVEPPENYTGHYLGSGDNYPLILLNHQEADEGVVIEFVAFMDSEYLCGIYFTGFIVRRILQEPHKKKNTWPTVFAPQNMTSLYKNRMGYVMCEERRTGNSTGPVETNKCQHAMGVLCGDMDYITKFSQNSCGALQTDQTVQQ